MKKIIFTASILFLTVAINSCKTQDKVKTENATEISAIDNVKSDLKSNEIAGKLAKSDILTKTDSELVNKYWKLVEIHGKPVVFENKNIKEPHMIFREEDNVVAGFLGCNGFSGTFELKQGNRISFSNMISTLKMCIGEGMDIEKEFNEVLKIADSYYINGNVLTLNRARMSPLAKFEVVYM